MTEPHPYPRHEMIELLEMHARSADRLTSSYAETAWMCREAAAHLRAAEAEGRAVLEAYELGKDREFMASIVRAALTHDKPND